MASITSDIELYKVLKQRLGEDEAEAIVGFVDFKLTEANRVNLNVLTTKEDTAKLAAETKQDIVKLSSDMKNDSIRLETLTRVETGRLKEDIAKLNGEMKETFAKLDGKIEKLNGETKAEIIKWMFIFWTGSILTTLGGMFMFLKVFLGK